MPTLQVRDVPEHIYRTLAEQAKRERRSLAQQAVATLAKGLQLQADPRERRQAALKRLRGSGPVKWALDPVALIRQDRGR